MTSKFNTACALLTIASELSIQSGLYVEQGKIDCSRLTIKLVSPDLIKAVLTYTFVENSTLIALRSELSFFWHNLKASSLQMTSSDDFHKIKIGRSLWTVRTNYQSLLPIQAGYGGVICRAQLASNQYVRIKQINLPPDTNKQRLKQIYREIKLAKHVNHENVAKFVDLFSYDQSIYLVTYSPGVDLAKLVETEEILNESEEVKLILTKQMFQGLNYLHNLGIIHKDLKPVNLVLDNLSHLRIVNFDLIRTGKYDPSSYGEKNCYLAPEILIEQGGFTKSIDVWSAGCILAELFISYCPFVADSPITHIQRIISLTGYPDEDYYKTLKEPMRNFLEVNFRGPAHTPRASFAEHFDQINNFLVIETLDFIFQLNPQNRPSCIDILDKELFKSIQTSQLTLAPVIPFDSSFEETDLSPDEIKELIMSELDLNDRFGRLSLKSGDQS